MDTYRHTYCESGDGSHRLLQLLWREDMNLALLDMMDDDKLLYTDKSLKPKNTPAYAPGGPYDSRNYQLPLWRLEPFLLKPVLVG
jgi:hypothetical protein